MTTISNKAALLTLLKPKTLTVDFPDGGSTIIRALTVDQVDQVRATIKQEEAEKSGSSESSKTDSFGLRLLLLSVIDGKGNRVFSDDDLPEIKKSGSAQVEHLVLEVMKLNGFHKAPAEKNSVTTTSDGSAAG